MKSLFGKLLASTMFAGMLAISVPASAAPNGPPVNILCQMLQNSVNALLQVGEESVLGQAAGLVNQMVSMGCPGDMIPILPR
ncbi:hypothetical protein D9O50_05500 [Oxalobacteraceae bacterium CAVE-383]|nr:hypothetical protein D9O50_05500 [Oxalobacteraceae bacterium CAVE-383]